MLNLKDTEFDDLFQRASDKYPLRIDSADWDKMASALDKDPTPGQIDGTQSDDRRRKRRAFWLLFFLPLAGVGYYALHRTGQSLPHPAVAVVTGSGNQQGAGANANTIQKAGRLDPSDPSTTSGTGEKSPTGASTNAIATDRQPIVTPTGATTRDPRRGSSQFADRSTNPANQSSGGAGNKRTNAIITQQDITEDQIDPMPVAGSSKRPSTGEPFTLRWAGDMQLARIAGDYRLSVDVTAPAVAKDNQPAKQKTSKQKTSYLYAGIFGAPDISTVKMQSVKGVGSTFGLLFGYAFNSRWSIETGAYLDQKRYYSEGEYFDTEKVRLPSYSKLLNVDGTCYMWEIPLNVRYTFNPQGKTKWFATAGFSTYLMSKENYTYAYQKMGSGITRDSAWNIKQPSQYPFSIVNLSAGFEQRLGRVGSLRVEPYARLPLGGIGTGKLPIMSVGINIGITRRLW